MAGSCSAPCFISILPEGLLIEIFLKLAAATLMRCRRVCKSWRSIISSPLFNQSRLAKAPSEVVIFRSGKIFNFLEGDESIPVAVSSHQKGSRYGSRRSVLHLVNSCNGLVCMTRCFGAGVSPTCSLSDRFCHGKTIFVVNPVMGQYIALPSCPKGWRMELCGMGFCPVTNQFKVFRFLSKRESWYDSLGHSDLSDTEFDDFVQKRESYVSDEEIGEKLKVLGVELDENLIGLPVNYDAKVNSDGDSVGNSSSERWVECSDEEDVTYSDIDLDDASDGDENEKPLNTVEVYTIGSGTWRRIEVNSGELENALDGDGYHSLSYVNGSLYWINERYSRFWVSSFNFESEQLKQITDYEFHSDHLFGLGTYKSCLFLCRYEFDECVDHGHSVGGDDDGSYVVEDDLGVELFLFKESSWSRECVVRFPKDFRINEWEHKVVKWFDNGDILFFKYPYLHLFNKEKQDVNWFSDWKVRSEEDAVVHVPSFLLLEDLIKGEPSKVLNVGLKKSSKHA